MVVSHYLISQIQVAGLIVELLGFFYLSLGIFGRVVVDIFRPLLPGTAATVLVGVFVVPYAGAPLMVRASLLLFTFILVYGFTYLAQVNAERFSATVSLITQISDLFKWILVLSLLFTS